MNKVKVNELLTALEAVMPGLAKKEIIEHANCFIFDEGKIYTFNDEISVSYPVKGIDINGAVSGKEFYDFMKNVEDEEVSIGLGDKSKVVVQGSSFEVKFNLRAAKMPTYVPTPDNWKKLPSNFKEGFEYLLLSVAKDMSNPVLTCIHWVRDVLESCDNIKYTRWQLDGGEIDEDWDILLSDNVGAQLLHYDPVEYSYSKDGCWLHLKMDNGCIFSCRTFLGKYPDTSVILKACQVDDGYEIELPEKLNNALDRASAVAIEDELGDKLVRLHFTSKGLYVRARSDLGVFKELINGSYDYSCSVSVYIKVLKAALKYFNKAILSSNKKMIMFKADYLTHVVSVAEEV